RLAGEGRVLSGHDAQQRALPHAVRADDADLRAGQEREVEVGDDALVRGMDLRDPLHNKDVVRHMAAVSGTTVHRWPAASACARPVEHTAEANRTQESPPPAAGGSRAGGGLS